MIGFAHSAGRVNGYANEQRRSEDDAHAVSDFVAHIDKFYRAAMLKMAWRILGDPVRAEDAVQETLLACAKSAASIKSNPRAWFMRAHFRKCVEMKKDVRREPQMLALNDDGPELPDPRSFKPVVDSSDSLAFALKNSGLTDQEAAVLDLKYLRHHTAREISEELGISEPRVSQLHAAALKRLRPLLEGEQ